MQEQSLTFLGSVSTSQTIFDPDEQGQGAIEVRGPVEENRLPRGGALLHTADTPRRSPF